MATLDRLTPYLDQLLDDDDVHDRVIRSLGRARQTALQGAAGVLQEGRAKQLRRERRRRNAKPLSQLWLAGTTATVALNHRGAYPATEQLGVPNGDSRRRSDCQPWPGRVDDPSSADTRAVRFGEGATHRHV